LTRAVVVSSQRDYLCTSMKRDVDSIANGVGGADKDPAPPAMLEDLFAPAGSPVPYLLEDRRSQGLLCSGVIDGLLGLTEAPAQCWSCYICGPEAVAADAAAFVRHLRRYERMSHESVKALMTTWEGGQLGDYSNRSVTDIGRTMDDALRQVESHLSNRYSGLRALRVIELSPSGAPHAHLLVWGCRLRLDRFQEACQAAGLGIGGKEIVGNMNSIVCYLLKTALWSLRLPSPNSERVWGFFMSLNGGEPFHLTGDWHYKGAAIGQNRWPARTASKGELADVLSWVSTWSFEDKMPTQLLDALRRPGGIASVERLWSSVA
jgi:hypothetical protein